MFDLKMIPSGAPWIVYQEKSACQNSVFASMTESMLTAGGTAAHSHP